MGDVVRGPIKAGLAAFFAVGVLLLLLNPPSLSGAEGLAVMIGGGLLLLLGTVGAFGTSGRESKSFFRSPQSGFLPPSSPVVFSREHSSAAGSC